MTIKKYLHSCVVLEEGGKRLLFDPGTFAFLEGKLQPEDIGPIDVVLITHTHPDHYFPEALKKLYALKSFTLIVSEGTKQTIDADGLGIPVQVIKPLETVVVEGFTIQAFDSPHEEIPVPCPHNMSYLINKEVYHPGDSYTFHAEAGAPKALLLPNGGPWATTKQTVAFAHAVMPEIAIPIHDAMHKDFWLERLNASMDGWMKDMHIEYRVLGVGESVEV